MSVVFCCLKNCFDGIGLSQNNIQRREVNPIVLDTGHMGKFETCNLHIIRLFRHSEWWYPISFGSLHIFMSLFGFQVMK